MPGSLPAKLRDRDTHEAVRAWRSQGSPVSRYSCVATSRTCYPTRLSAADRWIPELRYFCRSHSSSRKSFCVRAVIESPEAPKAANRSRTWLPRWKKNKKSERKVKREQKKGALTWWGITLLPVTHNVCGLSVYTMWLMRAPLRNLTGRASSVCITQWARVLATHSGFCSE